MDFQSSIPHDDFAEFRELALSAGVFPVGLIKGSRAAPDPKYFVGTGKADEIRQLVIANQAEVVLFDHALTPSQERNLEELCKCRVLDRTGLILDIFAQRARTFEGKLQVELAQLEHLASRLVRGWTHLERQKGGIGLRGPGETQLETDRRLIKVRIKTIRKKLDKVRAQREQGRRTRRRIPVPAVSLVGYTNAGKSTLFNALTTAQVYVANQLFATLDPTLRAIQLPPIGRVILIDTVGFIKYLPADLVAAFRATLEETSEASLLLHVVDAHHQEHLSYIDEVNEVLKQIKADKIPQLVVYNKIDLFPEETPRIDRVEDGKPWRVWVSAMQNLGLDLLKQAIMELLVEEVVVCDLVLTAEQGKLRAELYELGAVVAERNEGDHWVLSVQIERRDYDKLIGGGGQA